MIQLRNKHETLATFMMDWEVLTRATHDELIDSVHLFMYFYWEVHPLDIVYKTIIIIAGEEWNEPWKEYA